jgi:murein DD-endopeptidase MepM/ murein hydrolase activator NlpD
MSKRWVRRAVRILRHDLTLAALVLAFLAVSAGVMTAARYDPAVLEAFGVSAPPPVALEEDLARAEVPFEFVRRAPAPPPPHVEVTSGSIGRGESLASSLAAQGIGPQLVDLIASELSPLFDFRHAQPGHRYRLVRAEDGSLLEFRYLVSETDGYVLQRETGGDGFVAHRQEVELVPRVSRMAGIVTSTLHEAVVALGERGQLANDFSEIFAWDIDFSRSVRPGDEFSILYERLYRADGVEGEVYVRPGRILAARYNGAVGDFTALYFEPEEGHGGYYRPDGGSVEGQFLRAPLRYSRITSSFSEGRFHPILKITRPHHGIDYAAPLGTPVWAVGDGRVIYRGWAGGFGNLIKVRHNNGFVSYYSHLSRFAKGVAVGRAVQQKQVIGYVGQTGLATGPHVCFRISRDGKYLDPSRLRTQAGPPVARDMLPLFFAARDVLLAELVGTPAQLAAQRSDRG